MLLFKCVKQKYPYSRNFIIKVEQLLNEQIDWSD